MNRIEKLGPDQWKIYKRVRLEALKDEPDAFGSTYDQESQYIEGDWRRRLEKNDRKTFVAKLDSLIPIGLITCAPYGDKAGLFGMWVNPDYRGQGFGGQLVDVVIKYARDKKFSAILLDVADNNNLAIALYESKGFISTGIKGTLPPPRDSVVEHQRVLIL